MSPEAANPSPPQDGDADGLDHEALRLLAEAVLALRATVDLGVAWSVAARSAADALGAGDARLLRLDPRSGALTRIEGGGVETPYLSEHGGPVEWCLRQERALFDEGDAGERATRETLLWTQPPAALASLPLIAGGVTHGFLLVAFDSGRTFTPPRGDSCSRSPMRWRWHSNARRCGAPSMTSAPGPRASSAGCCPRRTAPPA